MSKSDSDVRRRYSGYLKINRLTDDAMRQLATILVNVPGFDLIAEVIELEYEGRDTHKLIPRTLVRLARLIGNASGEVRCQVEGDADQLWFEFYKIRDGHLWLERGEVVRQAAVDVDEGA